MSEIAIRTPNELVEWAASEERIQQYAMALPDDVNERAFTRALKTALIENPALLDADRGSLYLALLHSAQLGLVPDGRQAAIVVYENRKTGKKEAQLLPMISGVRDILAKFGWMLQTSVIYEADEFGFDEARQLVTHRPPRVGTPRGAIQGAYAQAVHKDGRRMAEVMSLDEIHLVRDKAPRARTSQWNDTQGYPRMVEKTPGHRLAKKLPLDPKDRERLNRIIVDELDPDQAVDALYGPQPSEQESRTPPRSDDAAGGEGNPPTPPAAPDPEDEPGPSELGAPAWDENDPTAHGEADVNELAAQAAAYVPPNDKYAAGGQHGPKTLAEILALGDDGERWIKWALSKVTSPPEYIAAVVSFARVHAVAAYQEYLARQEARA